MKTIKGVFSLCEGLKELRCFHFLHNAPFSSGVVGRNKLPKCYLLNSFLVAVMQIFEAAVLLSCFLCIPAVSDLMNHSRTPASL